MSEYVIIWGSIYFQDAYNNSGDLTIVGPATETEAKAIFEVASDWEVEDDRTPTGAEIVTGELTTPTITVEQWLHDEYDDVGTTADDPYPVADILVPLLDHHWPDWRAWGAPGSEV